MQSRPESKHLGTLMLQRTPSWLLFPGADSYLPGEVKLIFKNRILSRLFKGTKAI